MSFNLVAKIFIAAVVLVLILLTTAWIQKKLGHQRLKQPKYEKRWRAIGHHLKEESTWHLALIEADDLLDDVLKRRGFKGNSMGERLLNARQEFTDNDSVWVAHKLRDRLVHEHDVKLDEKTIKMALRAERQALKDLGALQ
ncbi:MAG: hypothetical protein ACREHG_01600 [Candidatus Saccharimonadales bacterium]